MRVIFCVSSLFFDLFPNLGISPSPYSTAAGYTFRLKYILYFTLYCVFLCMHIMIFKISCFAFVPPCTKGKITKCNEEIYFFKSLTIKFLKIPHHEFLEKLHTLTLLHTVINDYWLIISDNVHRLFVHGSSMVDTFFTW